MTAIDMANVEDAVFNSTCLLSVLLYGISDETDTLNVTEIVMTPETVEFVARAWAEVSSWRTSSTTHYSASLMRRPAVRCGRRTVPITRPLRACTRTSSRSPPLRRLTRSGELNQSVRYDGADLNALADHPGHLVPQHQPMLRRARAARGFQ